MPEISHFGGSYHLYYAISQFGRNRSIIGLATNKTLDRDSPDYRWEDKGKVIETQTGDDWNAIDPNIVLDEDQAVAGDGVVLERNQDAADRCPDWSFE